ncbi:hypothetical protein BRC21_00255 [Candidatus Saccharibacteria bacterium SW_7_54_9]|nr:MAG: hypothetical protein BRC21_00255 [Candidatus Saccharibacteria bacterium SW_7_54_9]
MARKAPTKQTETDATYFLKILLFFIVGAIWIEITAWNTSLPLGLGLGLLFASHDHFQIDRKIEYAVLLVAAIVSFAVPIGFMARI